MKNNRFLVVLLIFALFIPTYIGIYSYINTARTPVTPDSATGVTISDLAGKTYEATADSDRRACSAATPSFTTAVSS